jgi:hypothetical protein
MDHAVIVRPEGQHLHIAGLFGEMRFGIFLRGLGIHDATVRGDEGELEHLGAREAAGRVAGQGPDDVDHAVLRLVVQLRRLAAQLHGREDLDLDLAAGQLGDLLGPRVEQLRVRIGLGRQEVMQPQRHLGCSGRAHTKQRRSGHRRRAHADQGASGQRHEILLPPSRASVGPVQAPGY